MNILVKTMGGGIFSKFMVAIQYVDTNINNVDDIENIYIDINRDKSYISGRQVRWYNVVGDLNPFDFVLEQSMDTKFDVELLAKPHTTYKDIIKRGNLNRLKTIVSKLKIKKSVLDKINPNIDSSTLGVHIRLTDMDIYHPNGSNASLDNFYNNTVKIISQENGLDKIFVASDNDSSLTHFKNNLDIMYNEVSNRSKSPSDSKYQTELQIDMAASECFWVDSFLEMLSLSKCGKLLYRVSNLSNASVIFSNTITETKLL